MYAALIFFVLASVELNLKQTVAYYPLHLQFKKKFRIYLILLPFLFPSTDFSASSLSTGHQNSCFSSWKNTVIAVVKNI